MAVRDALLALLTLGPAYGFALHGGLAERTGGRRTVNVGQTYATLERLTRQGLVEPAGTTDDGLPLHRLTDTGRLAVEAWLDGQDAAGADPWDETVDRVLIAASLPGFDAASVIAAETRRWRERLDLARSQSGSAHDGDSSVHSDVDGTPASVPIGDDARPGSAAMAGLARLAASADLVRAEAAVTWLVSSEPLARDARLVFEPSTTRPRRGRRPGRTPATLLADATTSVSAAASTAASTSGSASADFGAASQASADA
ncbi:Transcriptional regulator PadR-like family protein [Agromyces sp. CF514]|uniref:PadR family transcriptional regulator n=1 Tax=Agromyces sp. CF514 TaxID=1881031 RepID=UPI0008F3FDC5|nr:helix-turn-helix transcriptional regulator [Agromyces sp. CF514]SFR78220.1 Transcriptional regulator PadR-like family protein [Agromyces sp. CF514]